jgi:hypothetical protein
VRAELDDPHAGMRPGRHKIWPSVFGDLISYHNDGKSRTVMGQKVRELE